MDKDISDKEEYLTWLRWTLKIRIRLLEAEGAELKVQLDRLNNEGKKAEDSNGGTNG